MAFSRYDYASADAAVLSAFNAKSAFERLFGNGTRIVKFNQSQFPFRQQVVDTLIERGLLKHAVPLERLHLEIGDDDRRLDESLQNKVAVSFYETPDAIMSTYRRFISEFLAKQVIGADVVFQAVPTFRFYFAGHDGYRDSPIIHSDTMLGHPPQEINLWIPLTKCFGHNAVAYADLHDSMAMLRANNFDFTKFDERPAEIASEIEPRLTYFEGDFGDCLMFDARCLHGTPINDTDTTRVSMDVRVMLKDDYDALEYEYSGTGRRHARFIRGDYYDQRTAFEVA